MSSRRRSSTARRRWRWPTARAPIGEPEEHKRVVVHPDAAILTAISDGKTLLTGGDDGRVVAIAG